MSILAINPGQNILQKSSASDQMERQRANKADSNFAERLKVAKENYKVEGDTSLSTTKLSKSSQGNGTDIASVEKVAESLEHQFLSLMLQMARSERGKEGYLGGAGEEMFEGELLGEIIASGGESSSIGIKDALLEELQTDNKEKK